MTEKKLAELRALMKEFLATIDDSEKDEFYMTYRSINNIGLRGFYESLGGNIDDWYKRDEAST